MRYRLLGNTGLHLSVIGLGGHWRTQDGRRYYDRFANDDVPTDLIRNRTEVVAACRDAGINYLDITTQAECLTYGAVLRGCRQDFILGADDYQWSARNPHCCNMAALIANVERCLTRLQTDYLDIWRVTAEVHGRNTDAQIESVIEAADRLRSAGKVRFLGVSSHHPGWIQDAVQNFAAFQIAIVPCTPLGCSFPRQPDPVRLMAERKLGVLSIKPFAGGLLFDGVDDDRLARLTLQYLLENRPQITSVLAGMTTVDEVSNAICAATSSPMAENEKHWLEERVLARLSRLPLEYAWLDQWHGIKKCVTR